MIRECRLDNGLTLLTETLPDLRSVALGVWLRQGSRAEPDVLGGISHFIEHLVFKGTTRRTALDIAREIDAMGGQMDAFTSKESTCFYVRVLDRHLDDALDLLADIVRHPRLDPGDIERERQVIFEEIRMVEDSPEELIFDMLYAARWGGHPLGRPIQGTPETVAAMDRDTLSGFFQSAYVPGQLLLTAAGNLRHEAIESMVRESFGPLPARTAQDGGGPPRDHGGVLRREKGELEQVHLAVGLGGLPQADPDRYALMVLSNLLGGTMSSRLFQKVREERGLAYSVYSSVNSYSDRGFQAVYVATRPEAAREALALIGAELSSLRDGPVAEQELTDSRENLKGTIMLNLESSYSRMANLARKELAYGRQFSLEEVLDGIDRVTSEDLHRLATATFRGDDVTLTAVGPASGLAVEPSDLGLA